MTTWQRETAIYTSVTYRFHHATPIRCRVVGLTCKKQTRQQPHVDRAGMNHSINSGAVHLHPESLAPSHHPATCNVDVSASETLFFGGAECETPVGDSEGEQRRRPLGGRQWSEDKLGVKQSKSTGVGGFGSGIPMSVGYGATGRMSCLRSCMGVLADAWRRGTQPHRLLGFTVRGHVGVIDGGSCREFGSTGCCALDIAL